MNWRKQGEVVTVKKRRIGPFSKIHEWKRVLRKFSLHTVCERARCPNIGECFSKGHATLIVLGPGCSRKCGFCHVWQMGEPLSEEEFNAEIERIIEYVEVTHPSYLVITSVTRDDLVDGGASFFVSLACALKENFQSLTLEFLIPDLRGVEDFVKMVASSPVDVVSHNVETVPSLYSIVRPHADYRRSLNVLRWISEEKGFAKTGILVGLGESIDELKATFRDLADAGVKMLTIGQYFRPSFENLPVKRYYSEDEFSMLEGLAKESGILYVLAGPYVRSSYMAEALWKEMSERRF